MSNNLFLIVSIIVLSAIAIFIIVFQINNDISLRYYHDCWEPIYKNRREHFDKYLKYALECRKEYETIEDVAKYAAQLNWEYDEINITEKSNKNIYVNKKKEEYLHELRCAGIE